MKSMKLWHALVAAVICAGALTFIGVAASDATKPDPEHKVWVCHANAGYGQLGNGYNLIHVDTASTRYQAHKAHATTHPKQNVYFGTLYDLIDVNPEEECGGPPPTTTTTETPETTSTVPATTTSVVPPTTQPPCEEGCEPTTTSPPGTTTVPPTTSEAPAVPTTAPPVTVPVAQPETPTKAQPVFTG